MFIDGTHNNKQNKKQKILDEKAVTSRQATPRFLVCLIASSLAFSNAPGHFLWSFRSWVYSLINSFAHLEGTTPEGKLGRDKPGYNLTAPTSITQVNAEDSNRPRYLIAKRISQLFLTRPTEIEGKRV